MKALQLFQVMEDVHVPGLEVLHDRLEAVLTGAHIVAGGCADTPTARPVRQRYLIRNDLGLPRALIVGGVAVA